MAAYKGSCTNLLHSGCTSTSSTATPAALTVTGNPGEIIYLRIWTSNNITDSYQVCATTPSTPSGGISPGSNGNTVNCDVAPTTFYDPGGLGGNYLPNQTSNYTICPSWNSGYVSVNFTDLNLGVGDRIVVLNGSLDQAPIIANITSTSTLPLTITSSFPGGCLQFLFLSNSDASVGRGWAADVSCTFTPGSNPGGTFVPSDMATNPLTSSLNCNGMGGIWVCGDGNVGLSNNNGGVGTVALAELGTQTLGCLSENTYTGEYGASAYWIYYQVSVAGTLSMSFGGPGGQNYDFAVYGPSTTYEIPCPASTGRGPIRCSNTTNSTDPPPVLSGSGYTGMGNGATDLFENQTGNGWVAPLNVQVGETYAMLLNIVQNGSPNPIVSLDLSGTAALDCDPILITLNVNLVSFEGINQGSSNLLTWITSSEQKNDFFTIQKSANGIDWENLGSVNGMGTTNEAHFYKMEDKNPISPLTYYRLIFTDINGKNGYSKIISVQSDKINVPLLSSIYPNPSDKEINFNYTSGNFTEPLYITVYNAIGEKVISKEYQVSSENQKLQINATNLLSGVYFLVANQGNKQYNTKFTILK
jgi:hypothetical protein